MVKAEADYLKILNNLLSSVPELSALLVIDKNGNEIVSVVPEGMAEDLEGFIIGSATSVLSASKLANQINWGQEIEQFNVRTPRGYIIMNGVSTDRILVAISNIDVKLGLVFLDLKRACNLIAKISYEMPARKVSLEEKLKELEDEFRENYKIFFSYAKTDSHYFKIKDIADHLEKKSANIEVMYFEKSKIAGEDILDYMERGVKWCNVFVWFHSENAENSSAVMKEYKMAEYLGKKIISITEDYNTLPLTARVTWALLYNEKPEIMGDVIHRDLKKLFEGGGM